MAREETSAANPDAEEARPAAVGKLFREQMCTGKVESYDNTLMRSESDVKN